MADVHADKNQDEWNEETVYGPSTRSKTSSSPPAQFPCPLPS